MVSAPQRYGSTDDCICSSDSTFTQSQNCIRSAPYALLSNRFPSPGHPPETHSHLWRLSIFSLLLSTLRSQDASKTHTSSVHRSKPTPGYSLPLQERETSSRCPMGALWPHSWPLPCGFPALVLPHHVSHTHQSSPFSGGFPGCLPGNPHSARAACMAVCKIFYLPHSLNLLSFLLTTSPNIIQPFCVSLIFIYSKRIPI